MPIGFSNLRLPPEDEEGEGEEKSKERNCLSREDVRVRRYKKDKG